MRWGFVRQLSSLQLKPQGPLQPTTTINDHRETILLYRALLRQCTYLPDSAARKYIWSHVVHRFHAYYTRVKLEDGRTLVRKRKLLDEKRLSGALKDARKSLKYLQRANDGHTQNLRTVLDMTYGRVGKRRRQLMFQLQAPDPLIDDASVAILSAQVSQQFNTKRVPELTDELAALLKSQIKQDSARFDKAPLRELAPKVPAVNIWQRKFPAKRRDNFIRAWYAKTLDRLMPPLKAVEWERLQGLAAGTIRWDGPVSRRKPGTSNAKVSYDAIHRVALGDLPCRLTSSTDRVVEKTQHPETVSRPHELTPRFMRRIWTTVFEKCPRLDYNHERKKWDVTWGNVRKQAELVFDSQKELSPHLFDGVDEHGEIRQVGIEPLPHPIAEAQPQLVT
ncbi:MAG: hypothetical protein Q9186_000875 [Xanthomendoza sp. 1 TL-2023]